jgi:hypothetical protein
MKVVVAIDTALLGLLCVLIVGLLRSHAEILRRTAPALTRSSHPRSRGERGGAERPP